MIENIVHIIFGLIALIHLYKLIEWYCELDPGYVPSLKEILGRWYSPFRIVAVISLVIIMYSSTTAAVSVIVLYYFRNKFYNIK